MPFTTCAFRSADYHNALRTFRELLDPKPVKKLRRRLRKVMEHCGAVRNCDVALELLLQSGISEGASVSKLKKAREQAGDQLHQFLKRERRRRHPAPSASLPPPDGDWKLDQTLEANLRRILPPLVQEFFAAGKMAAVPGATPSSMHQFRLSSKRFRYTLELFERFYGNEMARGAKALKGLQDRLGAINDCAATIDLLGRDRHAVAAIRKLLGPRIFEFRRYWENRFVSCKLVWWKRWLSRPAAVREPPRAAA